MRHLLRSASVAAALALGAAAPEPTTAAPAAPTPATVVTLLGLPVQADGQKEVGRIVDILVDESGRPRAVVVDVGGFLGVGDRKVAIEWQALHFDFGKSPVATLDGPATAIKSAPAYNAAKPVEAVPAPPAAGPGP